MRVLKIPKRPGWYWYVGPIPYQPAKTQTLVVQVGFFDEEYGDNPKKELMAWIPYMEWPERIETWASAAGGYGKWFGPMKIPVEVA